MKIHKSDVAYIARLNSGREQMSWRGIMDLVKERAIERREVLEERRAMGRCMDVFIEA